MLWANLDRVNSSRLGRAKLVVTDQRDGCSELVKITLLMMLEERSLEKTAAALYEL